MFDMFFVTNACFNTALPHCLFIEYEFQVCVCVSANDIKLVQALGNIISSAMKPLLTFTFFLMNHKQCFSCCTSCKMNGFRLCWTEEDF